jgi:hypothetical protein
MGTAAPNTPRTIEAGMLLIGLGAILLLVSLFLEWYQPGIDAWEVFEVWDLLLALLAIAALVAVGSRLGFGPRRPAMWLIVPAAVALIIVLYAIIDPPPVTGGLPDGDPGTGLWLALAAAVLMAAGALLSVARISVAITAAGSRDPASAAASRDPAVPAAAEPRRGGPFTRGGGTASDEPVAPGAPGAARADPTRRV